MSLGDIFAFAWLLCVGLLILWMAFLFITALSVALLSWPLGVAAFLQTPIGNETLDKVVAGILVTIALCGLIVGMLGAIGLDLKS